MKSHETPSTNSTKNEKSKPHRFWSWFWLSFLVLSLAYAGYSFYAPSNTVKWDNNITTIQELSKNSNKNTVLFFTGKWCSPCRIMKREIFADSIVEMILNTRFTSVMIDIDNTRTMELVNYYNIGATPTTIIVDPQGKVLDYAVGKIDKKKFLEMLSNSESH